MGKKGRPSKYNKETVPKLQKFIKKMTVTNFWSHCGKSSVAFYLDVTRETIYDWERKFPEFSDAIKKWEIKRDMLFLQIKSKQGAWIFLAKNWLGMTDKMEHEVITPITIIVPKEVIPNGNKSKE